jgi:hypothetical protein
MVLDILMSNVDIPFKRDRPQQQLVRQAHHRLVIAHMHQPVDPCDAHCLVRPHPLGGVAQQHLFDQFPLATPGRSDHQNRGAHPLVEGGREATLDLGLFDGQVAEVAVLVELLP